VFGIILTKFVNFYGIGRQTLSSLYPKQADSIGNSHESSRYLADALRRDGGKCSTRKVFDRETVRQIRASLGWVLSDNFRVGHLPASRYPLRQRDKHTISEKKEKKSFPRYFLKFTF